MCAEKYLKKNRVIKMHHTKYASDIEMRPRNGPTTRYRETVYVDHMNDILI